MRKRFSFLPIMAVCTLLIISCGKDDPDPAPAKTKTELITTGSWRFSSASVGGTDVSAFFQVCQKDNVVTFAAAGTGTLDEGATKCNAGDPQTQNFTWNFASNETQLFISATLFTGGSNTSTIVTLNESQLVISQQVIVSGTPQTAIFTFVH
ncbi:MAG: lipocalin family protein [Bacteroidetes bacterium]|nr:lipocalin family protein [Bacteroidota bacterium]